MEERRPKYKFNIKLKLIVHGIRNGRREGEYSHKVRKKNVVVACSELETMNDYWNSTPVGDRGKAAENFISMGNSPVNHFWSSSPFTRHCDEFFIDLFLFLSNALWVVQTNFSWAFYMPKWRKRRRRRRRREKDFAGKQNKRHGVRVN